MKKLQEILKTLPKKLITYISLGVTLLLSILILVFIILPAISALTSANTAVAAQEDRVSTLKRAIASLQAIDSNKLATYKNFVNTLVPDKIDIFHFSALNEIVATSAGAQTASLLVVKGAKPRSSTTTTTTTPTTTSGSSSSASSATLPQLRHLRSVLKSLIPPTTIL